jgi:hypothetical protein
VAQTNKRQVQLKNAHQKRTFYNKLLSNKIQSHHHKEIEQLVDILNKLNDNDFSAISEQIKGKK